MEQLTFAEMSLSEPIKAALKDMGFTHPSPIQVQAIPVVLDGSDIIGQAHTGTGKTAAFAIPIIEKIQTQTRVPQALILCPTRELAVQITDEFKRLMAYRQDVRIVTIYGGQPIERQLASLTRGVHIVVGTPGRVLDHLRRGTLSFDTINCVVLDEADEMLDRGFLPDIETILKKTPAKRQTLFFSATMSKEIMSLTRKYQNNPQVIKVSDAQRTMPKIVQHFVVLQEGGKFEVLRRFLDVRGYKLVVIFCRTKRRAADLSERLVRNGYTACGLHGDMRQPARDRVMAQFRSGKVNILVATDIAARGIDVENVEAVFNYDMPQDPEYYVHRIGRTGRAGKEGIAITFVAGRELYEFRRMMQVNNMEPAEIDIPSAEEAELLRLDRLLETMQKAPAGDLENYRPLFEKLVERSGESETLMGIRLLQLLFKRDDSNQPMPDETTPRRGGSRPPRRGGPRGRSGGYGGGRRPYRRNA